MPHHNRIPFVLTALLLSAALVAGACSGAQGNFVPLTTDSPVAQIADGLTVSANPAALAQDFGVRLTAIPAEAGAAWSQALAALPPHLRLHGSLFEIAASGTLPEQLFLAVIIPAHADPAGLDLYAWDGQAWSFLPAHVRGGQLVASVSHPPSLLGLFEAVPLPPLAFTTLEPGQTLTDDAASAVNGVLLGGVTVQPDGSLAGQLPNVPMDRNYVVYPLIRHTGSVLADPARRVNHMQTLAAFASSASFAGLALDYHDAADRLTFANFVRDLAAQLRPQGKSLLVFVDAPALPLDTADDGYWRALAASADALLLNAPPDPAAFGNGAVDALLAWAVGEVNRSRLHLVTSALSVQSADGQFTLLDPAAALAPLGSATIAPELPEALHAGQPISLTLTGRAQTLEYDAQASAPRYQYADDSGAAHSVWLTTADTLRQRLTLAQKYRLGGVVVSDLSAPRVPADMAEAVTRYKVDLAADVQARAGLVWTVSGPSGVLVQATAQPGQPFVYVAQTPGDYQFAAELQAGGATSLGSVGVSVVEAPPTPAPTAVAVTTGTGGTSSGGTTGGGSTGGFVPPPPIVAGTFELGGQVPGFIGHPAEMKQAGMTWVKFQATGDSAGLIAAGKGAGFKVLLSAVGDRGRAADPAYWPEYAAWVAGLAAQGADAIEIWNEANIDREWPTGQISGATYTELLKQAYTAIKAANSGTMVIGGAPAPTGAEGAFPGRVVNDDNFLRQMANAGAANYMDCVGIHYNTGTTSPHATTGSALSGYHYSYYFWPMVDLYYNTFGGSRPLCFTELGYVSPQGYESVPLPANFAWAAGITVAQQAQWLAEAASLSASSGKVRMMIVFNVDFTHYLSNDPQAGYAMIRPDGSCPACAALDAVMP